MKKIQISKEEASEFYKIHQTKPFYDALCAYLSSGPIIVMILEGENAVLKNRELNAIKTQLDKLKLVLKSENAEQIVEEIKNLEKISEFYVERRMNASIKTLIEGKGVDDIL